MVERQIREDFGSRLLQQDQSLNSDRYKEHRMQLEQRLKRAESRERLTKWVVVGAFLVAAAVFPILASRLFGSPDPYDKSATLLSVAVGVIYVVAWSVFFIGIASYYSRFLPRVRKAREELREGTVDELRREVAELRRLLEAMAQSRKSD